MNTDWGTIITTIACLFAILGAMSGLFLYLANKMDGMGKDMNNIGNKIEVLKNDMNSKIDTKIDDLRREIDNLRRDIHLETKDFHGRLCSIEERYHKSKNS